MIDLWRTIGRRLPRGWVLARWAAAPAPSGRQLRCLLLLALVLSLGLARLLLRPYPPITMMGAWDDYHLLAGLDAEHEFTHALGYFTGDWPEKNGFYRPLTGLSLWLDYRLWQRQTYGYRLTNWVLYVLTGVVLTLLVTALSGNRRYAVAALALFMVLPQPGSQAALPHLNTRGELLCGLFMLLTLYAGLRFLRAARARWLAAALLSKEMALTLPLLLVVSALPLLARRPQGRWQAVGRLTCLVSLGAFLVLAWIHLYHQFMGGRMPLPGGPLPRVVPSTPLSIAGVFLPDFVTLTLYCRGEKALADLVSGFLRAAIVRGLLWLGAMVWLARREPWLLAWYLLWAPLAWIPLRSVHISTNHYLYIPELNRYLALAVVLVMLGDWLQRHDQPRRALVATRNWLALTGSAGSNPAR